MEKNERKLLHMIEGLRAQLGSAQAGSPGVHAATHVNGTDDIRDATPTKKGLATAAQIAALYNAITAISALDATLAAHLLDLTIHFTEASIDHLNIQNIGSYTHAKIDTHLESYFNLLDYGCVGDGVTDDTANFQAALTAAAAAAPAGVVIPSGTFRIAAPLAPDSGVSILGLGLGSVIYNDADTNAIDIVGKLDVGCGNFRILGNGLPVSPVSGRGAIKALSGCVGLHVFNVWIQNVNTCGLVLDDVESALIEAVFIDNTFEHGLYIVDGDTVMLGGILCRNAGSNGGGAGDGVGLKVVDSQAVYASNSFFDNCLAHGVLIEKLTGACQDIILDNVTAHANAAAGFDGLYLKNLIDQIDVIGGHYTGQRGAHLYEDSGTGSSVAPKNVRFKSVHLIGADNPGIYAEDSLLTYISGCTLQSGSAPGIATSGGHVNHLYAKGCVVDGASSISIGSGTTNYRYEEMALKGDDHVVVIQAGNDITLTGHGGLVLLNTHDSAASDFDEILSGFIGQQITFMRDPSLAATITVKHGAVNLLLINDADYALDDNEKWITFQHNGVNWYQVGGNPFQVVEDDAFGVGWDGDLTHAPSQNAVYDAVSPLASSSHARLHALDSTSDHSATTDNTNFNASITKHGLMPKLSNVAAEFFNGVGAFAVPAYPVDVFGTPTVGQLATWLDANTIFGATASDAVNNAGAVMESDYNAQTILASILDNTPLPVTVDEQRLVGRITGGNITGLTPTQIRTLINVADGANAYVHPNHSGDVTSVGDGAQTIAADAVTNAKAANMAEATMKGRAVGAGTGDPTDLTPAQSRAVLGVEEDEKTWAIESPTTAVNLGFFTHKGFTITEMRAVLVGSTSGSVTWTVRHQPAATANGRKETGTEVVTSGTTTTSDTVGSDVTTLTNPVVSADSYVWLRLTAVSGTVGAIEITLIKQPT